VNARRLLIVLGSVVIGTAAMYALRPDDAPAVDFADNLTGPTSDQFDIPFEKFTMTPEGLLRSRSDSGRSAGTDRPLVRTRSDQYLSRDFVCEVDLMIPADVEDLAFVGFGDARGAAPYFEPSGVFGFRIHHLAGNREILLAAHPLAGATRGPGVVQEIVGTFPTSGALRVQLTRSGDRLTGSLPDYPGSEHTMNISDHPSILKSGRGFLYLTNSAEGTVFSKVRVRPRT
jgi:hypothetical protein